MYPHATLDDLRKAFPNSICPDKGVAENFLPKDEALTFNQNMSLYFAKDDELLSLADGSQVAMSQVWTKPSFERMVEQGKLYDIEVAEFEKTKQPGQKGGFRLEYLNGYVPPVLEQKKGGTPWWVWLLIALIAAGIAAWLFVPREKEIVEKTVEKIVKEEVVIHDTIFVEQVAEIEKNFNAAQFEQGKAELNDDAKFALHDLARVMKQNPDLKLEIKGHTSAEGDANLNKKLSEARARAAVDFLVNKEGIDSLRLAAHGMGSTELKDPQNPESDVNRRTEFKIIE